MPDVNEIIERLRDESSNLGNNHYYVTLGEAVAAVREAAQPDTTREAVEALPRWIAVEQAAGYQANVNAPGPVMHAAVLLDDVLDLLAAPSHRGDEGGKNPGDGPDHEPSPGAAARPVPAPDNPQSAEEVLRYHTKWCEDYDDRNLGPMVPINGAREAVAAAFAAGRAADQQLRDALREIRDNNYELCDHRACASSYNAWAIADAALAASSRDTPTPEDTDE